MQTDYLIVGQGICGTFLSKYLLDAGKKVLVIDNNTSTASRISSGVINPVTGRRIVRTWMIEKLMAFSKEAYQDWENLIGNAVIKAYDLIDFHPNPQMQQTFAARLQEEYEFLQAEPNTEKWKPFFNFQFGAGKIAPCYLVKVNTILNQWRNTLKEQNLLVEEDFLWKECYYDEEKIVWQNIEASKVILCNGAMHQNNSPFSLLPFANNKGEAIIAEIPELPENHIYKQSLSIVPWQNGNYWIGSTYEWDYKDVYPSNTFREKVKFQLKNWLKVPFKILDHFAAERPATLERRPFVGIHPKHPGIAILNGMGTKGCSLAPYFAKQLCAHLTEGKPIDPLADVKRFSKVLSANS